MMCFFCIQPFAILQRIFLDSEKEINVRRRTFTLLVVFFFQSNVTHQAAAEPELESSRVKEAALDDKLGVELRSIVEQIQVMDNDNVFRWD